MLEAVTKNSYAYSSLQQDYTNIIILIVLVLFSLISATIMFIAGRYPQTKLIFSKIISVIKSISDVVFSKLYSSSGSFAGFKYDKRQDILYSDINALQRDFGYCRLYDEATARVGMIIDCEPVYFEYGRKKWLIEFWKGQYGVTTGCEIGIYNTTRPNLNIPDIFNGTFYDCADDSDMLYISYVLLKNGKRLFSRSAVHWWLTGFKLGEFLQPSELSARITLVLKDGDMRNAFKNGLVAAGYKNSEIDVNGNAVRFAYTKPRTAQPASRTKQLEKQMQKTNRELCEHFNELTKNYKDSLSKLDVVSKQDPSMYNEISDLGGSKIISDKYNLLAEFLD